MDVLSVSPSPSSNPTRGHIFKRERRVRVSKVSSNQGTPNQIEGHMYIKVHQIKGERERERETRQLASGRQADAAEKENRKARRRSTPTERVSQAPHSIPFFPIPFHSIPFQSNPFQSNLNPSHPIPPQSNHRSFLTWTESGWYGTGQTFVSAALLTLSCGTFTG